MAGFGKFSFMYNTIKSIFDLFLYCILIVFYFMEVLFQLVSFAFVVTAGPAVIILLAATKGNLLSFSSYFT